MACPLAPLTALHEVLCIPKRCRPIKALTRCFANDASGCLVCAAQALVDAPEEGLACLSGQAPQVGCTDASLVEDAADIAVISCSMLESLCFVFGTFTCEVLEYYLSPVASSTKTKTKQSD